MSQEKYNNYYIGEKEVSSNLINEYNETIRSKRDKLFQKLLDETGAIAWRESHHWGEDSFVTDLVFPIDSEKVEGSHIKITRHDVYEGQRVYCARGKLNSKKGEEFNTPMNNVNEQLKFLPSFSTWFIDKFDLKRCGIGGRHPNGGGFSMMSTNAGYYDKQIAVTIPNTECQGVKDLPEMPDFLREVTYGEFYDFTNQ